MLGVEDGSAGPVIAEVMQAMQTSLATLRLVGQTLGDALTGLERDSDRVEQLLVETVANLANHDEIGRALREAATALAEKPDRPTGASHLSPRVEQMLDQMARSYTMAQERQVHDRVLGRSSPAPARPAAAAPAELEDGLF